MREFTSRIGRGLGLALPFLLLLGAGAAFGQDMVQPEIEDPSGFLLDTGNTAWILTSSALVLMMTLPGLALFYGGLVRGKNILSVLMQCMISAGLVGVLWVVVGYSWAFGGEGNYVGDFSNILLSNYTANTEGAMTGVPAYVFVVFQGMFAIITPALMLGAFAERMRFSAYVIFIAVWVLVVYCPLAHMVWGGGMISQWGALDFAGGLVVHMSSGFSALAACIILGKRKGFGQEHMTPHNLPFTVIGACLLWVGWFGFNAGSAGAADGTAGLAFLTTQTATATAVLVWVLIEWIHRGNPTVLGAATAAVAGLVAITPACDAVSPGGSILVGVGAAIFCYIAVTALKPAFGYDDSLDVFGVHGIGGAWGALATGLFIAETTEAGWGGQVLIQLGSILFTAVFAIVLTVVILMIMKLILGDLRVDEEAEDTGLDLSEHSEAAYGPMS